MPADRIPLPPAVLIFAFRYALGRMSTAPSLVAELLIAHAGRLDSYTRVQIVADIEAAIAGDRAGMACDVDTWRRVAEVLSATHTPRDLVHHPHDKETHV